MFDLKWIAENPKPFDEGLRKRGIEPHSAKIAALDKKRRALLTEMQEGQARRNTISREIGAIKKKGGDAEDLIGEMSALKDKLQALDEQAGEIMDELDQLIAGLPNIPESGVPDGEDESANEEIRCWGDKPDFEFEPKEHFDLGENLSQMDFETAAKMSGARFVVLSKGLARLSRALASYMIERHVEAGYTEVAVPYLVRDHAVFGTGQLPKFADDLFRTSDDYWLIPTGEVPLANLVADSIMDEDSLPRRYVSYTPCFRAEAGAAGRDTRGMIRQHQFDKVELVSIVKPDRSDEELEFLTGCAETIMQELGLPYRVMLLCAGDMGFAASKTYDIEVWLPGQETYREISSCSNCGEFQARRMKARYRPQGEKGGIHVHTLNGSGLAIGRCLVAVMENNQQKDGSIRIPPVLRPYMGGREAITADD